ncbi:MAG: class I SAM-dependent methyltransferase [Isosphaeraceae bacterium]|nr:class I SAM-dependent methyltransferase [Isosphaeraceae bacterium]
MKTLGRKLRNAGKRNLRRVFEIGQHLGVDLLPRHFYSEVPDLRGLKQSSRWKEPRSMVGVRGTAIDEQMAFVAACCPEAMVDRLARGDLYSLACSANGAAGFGPIEAEFLHAFLCSQGIRRVVQVGCGVSTAVMLQAAEEAGTPLELLCIEPYPTAFLREADRRGQIELVPEKAQDVPLALLTDLGDDGLLFIDSTHAVGPGSEVNRVIFEVLPRLKAGDWVHFHDIYFPYDYQRGLLDGELFFNNESALLHAFLIGNPRFSIRASLSMLHYADPAGLQRYLPNYRPAQNDHGLSASEGHFPSSTYLRVYD